jgi:hypothetical protein
MRFCAEAWSYGFLHPESSDLVNDDMSLSFFTKCLDQSFPEETAVPCLSNVSHRQNQTQKVTPRFSLVDQRTLVPMHQGSLSLFLHGDYSLVHHLRLVFILRSLLVFS